jgi:hypothetical protein
MDWHAVIAFLSGSEWDIPKRVRRQEIHSNGGQMADISRSSVGGAPIERRLFSEGQLSVGLTLPLLSSGNIVADFDEQIASVKLSDELGFSALWVRDVPLNSIDYPDPVGHLDPWVFLGALASHTQKIALVSGAIVLT